METIGQRVDALRQGLRLTISELARRCEVTQPTMTNIIGGKTKSVKGYVLDALARELNTTVSARPLVFMRLPAGSHKKCTI